MGRLLMVLCLAGLGWWGYSTWFSGPGDPDPGTTLSPTVSLEQQLRAVDLAPAADPAEGPVPLAARPGAEEQEPALRIADAVRAREPAAVEVAFAYLVEAEGSARQALAAALSEGVSAAPPEEVLVLLGSGNAFLHTPEGRAAGERVIAAVSALPDERSAALLTSLVDKAMRGPIAPGDQAAKTFVTRAYEALKKVVRRHVFDPTNLTRARSYTIRSGDSLSRIAQKFSREHDLKIESGTLAMVNRITNPNSIQAGKTLKVPMDPIRTVIEKRSFLMAVYLGETIVRLYWIGHGEDDITPETEFTVGEKVERPDWYHPDGRVIPYGSPDNVLGDYFVQFDHPSYTGFGAHGTDRPESVGTMASMGCIRMYDADIEEYFGFIPRGSAVVVRDSR